MSFQVLYQLKIFSKIYIYKKGSIIYPFIFFVFIIYTLKMFSYILKTY